MFLASDYQLMIDNCHKMIEDIESLCSPTSILNEQPLRCAAGDVRSLLSPGDILPWESIPDFLKKEAQWWAREAPSHPQGELET